MTRAPVPRDALLTRTPAGTAELNQPSNALTLAQRKLLLLIQRGTTFQSLMDNSSSIDPGARDDDLARLFALRCVAATDRAGNAIDALPPATRAPGLASTHEATQSTDTAELMSTALDNDDTQSVHELRDRNELLASNPRRRRGPYIAMVVVLLVLAAGLIRWQLLSDDTGNPSGVEGAKPEGSTSPVTQRPLYPDEPVMPSAAGLAPATGLPSAAGRPPVAGLPPAAGQSDVGTDRAQTQPTAPRQVATAPAASGSRREAADAAKTSPNTNAPGPAMSAAAPAAPTALDAAPARPAAVASPVSPPAATASLQPPPSLLPASPTSTTLTNVKSPASSAPAPAASASAPPPVLQEPTVAKPTPPAAAPPAAAPPAPTSVASAPATTPRLTRPPSAPRLIVRVNPDFPPDAARAGIKSGTVRARMKVDADGQVTDVEILESSPARVFDRVVLRALAQWKFEATGAARTVDHEVEFR